MFLFLVLLGEQRETRSMLIPEDQFRPAYGRGGKGPARHRGRNCLRLAQSNAEPLGVLRALEKLKGALPRFARLCYSCVRSTRGATGASPDCA